MEPFTESTPYCNTVLTRRSAFAFVGGEDDDVPATAAAELDIVRGIAPAELASRCRIYADGLGTARLRDWLVREGYAVLRHGLLVPTPALFELEWPSALVEVADP